MCDPISIAVAASVASAGASVLSGITQGNLAEAEAQARADQLAYDAALADQDVYLADLKGKEALGIAATQALVPEIASTRVVSSMRAQAGASGLSLNKGYGTLERDVERRRYKAAERIILAGDKEAYAHQLDAYSAEQTAVNLRHGAATAKVLGKYRKRAAIFGGVANAAATGAQGATYFL